LSTTWFSTGASGVRKLLRDCASQPACLQSRSIISASPARPSDLSAAQTSSARARREASGVTSIALRCAPSSK